MKTKFFLISLILGAGLLVACYNAPSETDLQDYLTVMRPYYPYSVDDAFVFVNDSSGGKWIGYPYDYYKDGIYPYTDIYKSSSDYAAEATICAWVQTEEGGTRTGEIGTKILYMAGEYVMSWNIALRLNDSVSFHGGFQCCCSESEILASFTDTILLPIPYQHDPKTPMVEFGEPYARIVKHQGLTDFSVDGKTVWRKVKE